MTGGVAVKVNITGNVSQQEIEMLVKEEQVRFLSQGKELAEVEIIEISPEELEVRSRAKSPIKRIRRITGYLSTIDKFNDAKQAELADRVMHQ